MDKLSLKVDQMNKRVDDLFFQYEDKMNNIQREYKNFVIKDILPILYENILSINKELNEYVNNKLLQELNKIMENEENEEYKKNIQFQLKIIEIIRQATKEYYQKAS